MAQQIDQLGWRGRGVVLFMDVAVYLKANFKPIVSNPISPLYFKNACNQLGQAGGGFPGSGDDFLDTGIDQGNRAGTYW